MKSHILSAIFLGTLLTISHAATPVAGLVPAQGGILPSGINSDQLAWEHFVQVTAPVSKTQAEFETWASDPDIYTDNPKWPSPSEAGVKKFRPGLLQMAKAPHAIALSANIDGKCNPVSDATAGNFPVKVSTPPPQPNVLLSPQPCYAEEVRRNKPSFDYIVENKLYTQPGLAQAFEKATTTNWKVSLPKEAVEVKADWLPVDTLIDWLAANHVKLSLAQIKKQYYITVSEGVTYGLVSMHISSKEIPNWVWASFENKNKPGRCDTMGCNDSFGAVQSKIAPALVSAPNGQYGNCTKIPALEKMFKEKHLAGVWNQYCLKASQIDFVDKHGVPLMLGDSFTERIAAGVPINQSSCIACHAAAAVLKSGAPFLTLLNASPMGKVELPVDAVSVDFIWGILVAPSK